VNDLGDEDPARHKEALEEFERALSELKPRRVIPSTIVDLFVVGARSSGKTQLIYAAARSLMAGSKDVDSTLLSKGFSFTKARTDATGVAGARPVVVSAEALLAAAAPLPSWAGVTQRLGLVRRSTSFWRVAMLLVFGLLFGVGTVLALPKVTGWSPPNYYVSLLIILVSMLPQLAYAGFVWGPLFLKGRTYGQDELVEIVFWDVKGEQASNRFGACLDFLTKSEKLKEARSGYRRWHVASAIICNPLEVGSVTTSGPSPATLYSEIRQNVHALASPRSLPVLRVVPRNDLYTLLRHLREKGVRKVTIVPPIGDVHELDLAAMITAIEDDRPTGSSMVTLRYDAAPNPAFEPPPEAYLKQDSPEPELTFKYSFHEQAVPLPPKPREQFLSWLVEAVWPYGWRPEAVASGPFPPPAAASPAPGARDRGDAGFAKTN
jgi:hypothetical protein